MNQELLEIESLFFSDEFSELNAYSNRFDLFKIMRIQNKELIHSNVLAALLNPNSTHGMGHTFLNLFMKELKKCDLSNGENKKIDISLATIISTLDSKVSVYRELDFIDLVVEFPETNVVVGIENKIWSDEQGRQIERYQNSLSLRYPKYTKVMVFLTPSGRKSDTANENSDIPVYCMSYQAIVKMVKASKDNANQSAQFFLDQFIYHVESYMTGSNEVDELCWQIFQKHQKAYERMSNRIEYCKNRRVKELFDSISEKIKIEYGLIPVPFYNSEDCKYDLHIRKENWPKNVWIKIYKHVWFGVFPFVKEDHKNLIEQYFNIQKPESTKSWNGYYYFSDRNLDDERCIKKNGNEIDEMDISRALKKFEQFIAEIDDVVASLHSPLLNELTDDQ